MKRSTASLVAAAAILIAGGVAIWLFIVAPRLKPPAVPAPAPVPAVEPPKAVERHGALNLYLAAPETLPTGATRVELTLAKAAIVDEAGIESPVFEGAQRVVLQPGVAEKVLSELIPNGKMRRLKLEFSPAAELSMADGSTIAAVVERREAVLSFEAEVPVSHSLALFARLPLEPGLKKTGAAWAAEITPDPLAAEAYVFGSFLLDPRGMGDLWTVPRLTLSDVIKADLGLDIKTTLPGSQGFNAAEQLPTAKPPL